MITFRPHERIDIPFRIKWLNNKKANIFAIDDPEHETTETEQGKWFDGYEEKLKLGEKKFFTICDSDKPIGFVGLSKIDKETKSADVFIMIGEDEYRGKGIGKRTLNFLINFAFTKLKLTSLTLGVDKQNEAAIRLYQSAGFKETGELEEKMVEMKLGLPIKQ
jgi:RimJ/RimL family protein N-acetyltransferase